MISGLLRLIYFPDQAGADLRAARRCGPCVCPKSQSNSRYTRSSDDFRLALALLPIIRGIARDGGVRSAVPAARPLRPSMMSRGSLRSVQRSTLCIFIGGELFRRRVAGELRHVIVVGVWNVHDAERVSDCRIVFGCGGSLCDLGFHRSLQLQRPASLRTAWPASWSVGSQNWGRGGHPISGRTLPGYLERLRRSMIRRAVHRAHATSACGAQRLLREQAHRDRRAADRRARVRR